MDLQHIKLLLQQLVGMPVSHPWRGCGSAVFLELGNLRVETIGDPTRTRGTACIMIEWDWRIERDHTVVAGSSNSAPAVISRVAALKGEFIESIAIDGKPPELVIRFSNGSRLRSMAMVAGDPQWSIRLPDDRCLLCEDGKVIFEEDTTKQKLSDEEREVANRARVIVERWGRPSADPVAGKCRNCECFVRLDDEFDLLDYGVCTNARSPFDGRATYLSSGCPAFAAWTR